MKRQNHCTSGNSWFPLAFHNAIAAETQSVSFTQIPSEAAFKLAHEAVNQCEADGYKVSATVVDLSGNVIAQLLPHGAGIHTLDSSRKKLLQ